MSTILSISSSRTLGGNRNRGMLDRIRPPVTSSFSNMVTAYPSGSKSFATVSEAQPAPTQAIRLPFFFSGIFGRRVLISSL